MAFHEANGVNTGCLLRFPEGWRGFKSSDELYFLSSQSDPCRVLLVQFIEKTKTIEVELFLIGRDEFEMGISKRLIIVSEKPEEIPPWFPKQKDRSWATSRLKKHPKEEERTKKRIKIIENAIRWPNEWMNARYPIKVLNRLAREASANVSRFKLWTVTYLLFGRNESVIQPASWNIGKYDRTLDGVPLGNRSRNGKCYGLRINDEDKKKFEKGYKKNKAKGKTLCEIYTETLVNIYGGSKARVRKAVKGNKNPVHDYAGVMPTFNQFRYYIHKRIGKKQIQIDKYGTEKIREKEQGSRGSYSEGLANLCEKVERDAYWMNELPQGINGEDLKPISVVLMRDVLSGLITGIGFSIGGENSIAYNMAEFCAAIDKKEFARIMGIEDFQSDMWPSYGVSPNTVTDRGPGANAGNKEVFTELTQSWSPQSKATIESINPKKYKASGPKEFIRSGLSPMQLMRSAIRLVVEKNETTNNINKLTNEMLIAGVPSTPVGIWEYLNMKGRNDSVVITFDEAVRRYLPKTELSINESGIWYGRQKYHSLELYETGILDRARNGTFSVKCFYLPLNIRQIWLDEGGGLLEVPAVMRLIDNTEQLYITVEERELLDDLTKTTESEHRFHKQAIRFEMAATAHSETGRSLHGGKRVKGRPKNNTVEAKNQLKTLKNIFK